MTADVLLASRAPAAARRMAEAALRFLDALTDEQRAVATFPFPGDERYQWHYTPVARNGLRLKDMTGPQREAALALFDAGLSARGARTARQIIALEPILRETERIEGIATQWLRDPELYYFSVFGEPGTPAPWAWRAGGHHIGLHFTVVDRDLDAPTPLFFGANPAEVRHGPATGRRTLPEEEDLGRALLTGLDPAHRAVAVVDSVAPDDILTKNYRVADPAAPPRGLRYAAMSGEERERLVRLVRHYVERVADDLSAPAWAGIERAGLDAVAFAWAGPAEPGQGHYYAVVGPTFLIEYDNTQNDANHIHSVWRDFTNDWGEDLLARHYAEAH
ncbi:MAG TPA: DUF3500 domain-containing protein [Thermomicrobiales bacterium]|nr:DUF3500 domain-containing protein [Thermomicrobiales bacterium]